MYFWAITILFFVFKIEIVIGSVIFFPWLVAYFYRKSGAIPWSVWEENPNTKIWGKKQICDSDFKRHHV
jgi:hypothetical protein